ncbi:MAG: bifunctional UDP-N-acetylglucosamine diphosphorylase/glucosamine-1-phosphate N-acetyltransferase GlmU [Rhodospirillales bacterium]
MSRRRTAAIVLAAGHGTRMKSSMPKVMHPLAGRPMLRHILATLGHAGINDICVVVGPDMGDVREIAQPYATAVQTERLGTAHAALAAKDAIPPDIDDLLILNGDNPLIPAASIEALLARRAGADNPAVVVLGFRSSSTHAYGRLVVSDDGTLYRIVEARDADPEEFAIDLCSSGMMALDGASGFEMLAEIENDNAQGEYYLPDIVHAARERDRVCTFVEGPEADLLGINSRAELATAEARIQQHLRADAMAGGATLIAPETVFFSFDTKIGRDVVIEPNVVIGPGVEIADGVTIRAFSHLEGATVGTGATVGPFARLRPGANLAENVHIGNFVEVKNANIGEGAKANHLSYVGDSDVGAGANIGAGTITCNYDGVFKWRTTIGEGAFIGSNTSLVAPVTVGPGAVTGAGSTIAKDVAADALAVTRAPQKELKDWGRQTRERKLALKAKGEKG